MTKGSAISAIPLPTYASRLAHFGSVAMIAAAPLVMSTMTARSFEAVKTSALVPLAVLLIPGLLIAADRDAVRRAFAAAPGAYLAAGVLLLALTASTWLSETPWIAFFGSYYRREGLLAWLACGLLFWYLATAADAPDVKLLLRLAAAISVAPCAYAILQRFGHDFFSTAMIGSGGPRVRPGGTLGNASYLGAYLVLIIPATLYCALTEKALFTRLAWIAILALQAACMALTLSRGPQLGLVFAMAFMGVTTAGLYHPRLLRTGLVVLIAGTFVGALLWFTPPAREWLLGQPLAERWLASGLQDASVAIRMAIWRVGFETLADAPLLRLLFGYGPDATYFAYYPHIPYSLLSANGMLDTIDRLHNDPLDLAANCGVAGALAYVTMIALLVLGAARRVFGLSGPRHAAGFAAASATGGLGAACLAVLSPGHAEWIPAAFAWGLAAGWAGYFCRHALRARGAGHSTDEVQRNLLLIALTAGIIGYWIDAQVSVPTLATRIVFFALAALLLRALYDRDAALPLPSGVHRPAVRATLACASVSAIVLAISSFFPADFNVSIDPPSASGLAAKAAVLAALVGAGMLLFRVELRSHPGARVYAAGLAAAVSGFAAVYGVAAWSIARASDADLDLRLAALPALSVATAALSCIVLAAYGLPRGGNGGLSTRRAAAQLLAIAASGVLLAAAASLEWRATRADILSKLASWAYSSGRTEQALAFLDRAVTLLPREKHYAVASGTRELEEVVRRLGTPLDDAALRALGAKLDHAELKVRSALTAAPADPWCILGLANVLQVRALSGLREWVGVERGERAAVEARELFGRARAAFPAQPLILRNWAQLEFDQGDARRGFALLDAYEALDPGDMQPYRERMAYAVATGDTAEVHSTLQRAARFLGADGMRTLRNIATPSTVP